MARENSRRATVVMRDGTNGKVMIDPLSGTARSPFRMFEGCVLTRGRKGPRRRRPAPARGGTGDEGRVRYVADILPMIKRIRAVPARLNSVPKGDIGRPVACKTRRIP